MNDPKELIVKIDPSQVQGIVAEVEAKVYPVVQKLVAENSELKAHIRRWANEGSIPETEHYIDFDGCCEGCGHEWPCMAAVVKGWGVKGE